MIKNLIQYTINKLVDKSDRIVITQTETEQGIRIELKVPREDLGKVIGKEGRTARALRALANATAPRQERRVTVDINELI